MTIAKATSQLYYGSHPIYAQTWPDSMAREIDSAWRYGILARIGITHILNLSEAPEDSIHAGCFRVLHLFRHDNLAARGNDYWQAAAAFYADALAGNGKLFVHCDGGRSRSVATAIVLLISSGMTEQDARAAVGRWGNAYVEDGKKWLAAIGR